MKKVALVGCGRWGRNHAKHLSELGCEFVGIADPDIEIEQVAKQFNTNYFKDYKELPSNIDAVLVVASTNRHYEIVKYFLEKGKNVFVEKPCAQTQIQVKELIDLATMNNLILNTGYLMRFNPAVQKLKERLLEVGQIRYVRATNIHERQARTDSGVIINLGIHPLDIILFLFNQKPYGLKCMTTGSPNLEKAAILSLDYGSYIVVIEAACEAHGLKDKTVEVVGERATFRLNWLEQSLIKYVQGKEPEIWKPEIETDFLMEEIKHFLECLEFGNNNNNNLGKEDLITMKICDHALESAINRRWVHLQWDH